MGEEGLGEALAVETDGLDVGAVLAVAFDVDDQFLAAGQVNLGVREPGAADGVDRDAGAYLVESQGVEHIPGGHLAAVLVAAQTVGGGGVHLLENLVYILLGAVGSAGVVVEVDDVVRGLVTVGVLADEAGDVGGDQFAGQRGVGGEQRVEALHEGLAASEQGDEAVDVVRCVPGPLPGCALAVVVAAVIGGVRSERLMPLAVLAFAAEEAGLGVVIIAVILPLGLEFLHGLLVTGGLGDAGDAPVVVGVLQALGHGFPLGIPGHETQGVLHLLGLGHQATLDVGGGDDVGVQFAAGALAGGLQGGLDIEVGVPLGDGVGHEGDGVVAGHTGSVVAVQLPHGEQSALPVFLQQGADVLLVGLGVDDGVQRVQGAVGVPQGEDGIHRPGGVTLMHLQVHAEVAAVGVLEQIGGYVAVVQGGIEDGAVLGVVSGDVDFTEGLLPFVLGLGLYPLKIPTGLFGEQVVPGAGLVNGGDGQFH